MNIRSYIQSYIKTLMEVKEEEKKKGEPLEKKTNSGADEIFEPNFYEPSFLPQDVRVQLANLGLHPIDKFIDKVNFINSIPKSVRIILPNQNSFNIVFEEYGMVLKSGTHNIDLSDLRNKSIAQKEINRLLTGPVVSGEPVDDIGGGSGFDSSGAPSAGGGGGVDDFGNTGGDTGDTDDIDIEDDDTVAELRRIVRETIGFLNKNQSNIKVFKNPKKDKLREQEKPTHIILTNVYYFGGEKYEYHPRDEDLYNEYGGNAVPAYEIEGMDIKGIMRRNPIYLYIKRGTKGWFKDNHFETEEGSDTRLEPKYVKNL